MDSGIVRLLIVIALFILLAGDYGSIIDHVTRAFTNDESPSTKKGSSLSKGGNKHASSSSATTTSADDDDGSVEIIGRTTRSHLMNTMKHSCLPKLICELNAAPHKEKLSESEKSLLALISDTTISTTAEVTSKYHFAAHMGQLISGVDGTGCHNFYPSCPFPGLQVLSMIKSIRLRPH